MIIPIIQWIMAEMVRFSSVGTDISAAAVLIDGLTDRIYPLFEQIKNRTYVNAQKLGAPALALLLAYESYPERIRKDQLEDAIIRHGVSRKAASMAIHRNRTLFDFAEDGLLLRVPGREKAESLLKKLQPEAI